eukprot:g32612.t1
MWKLAALPLALASLELQCLQLLHRNHGIFSAVHELQDHQEEFTAACHQLSATTALRVHLPRKREYLERIRLELEARGQVLLGNLSAQLFICLPSACISHSSLVRLVIHYCILTTWFQVAPPLPQALQPSELRWKFLTIDPELSNESLANSSFGQCDLQRPGQLRRQALKRIGPSDPLHREMPHHIADLMPKQCYHAYARHESGSCAAASLSRALVLAAAARQPATLLARLDDAVLAALAMRDCPWPLLDAFACNNCVAPPVGFRPAALLQKTRAAHAAFARGQTLFKDPLRWTSGELSCKPAATDALWDIMLGRCMVASNVTAHPAVEDELGRYYFATEPLPCQEHLNSRQLPQLRSPHMEGSRLPRVANALCDIYGFMPELHRYLMCEPEVAVADYWVSPYAIGFHGYKNTSLLLHAYRILYGKASCDWVLSFRPKVLRREKPGQPPLRAIAKVQDCIQRFVSSDDAFTTASDLTHQEAVPPSALCVSVLRDRVWRQLPYNMVVEGDVFKLREGETFPCHAERLAVRLPYGAIPSGQMFRAREVFAPAPQLVQPASQPAEAFGARAAEVPAVASFRARSTACVPMVRKFLQSAQREGRTDTVFFEVAALVRDRLKKISMVAFVSSTCACGLWLLQPAVKEQSLQWHLQRFLLPLRVILCLLPLLPAILLQVTDIWGNARIQSLFQWHAGLSDEDKELEKSDEQSLSGEIDASRVPLQWQLKELFGILWQGLEGHANLMHTLNSTTVVCFCDREGLLTDTCTTVAELCLCGSKRQRKNSVFSDAGTHSVPASEAGNEEHQRSHSYRSGRSPSKKTPDESQPSPDREESKEEEVMEESNFTTVVLDVQSDHHAPSGLRFEEADWRQHLSSLKPLCLSMAVSRQPRELFSQKEGPMLFDLMAGDLLQAMHRGTSAAMHDCTCTMSQLIGFREDVVAGFTDVKFCMELCRPLKLQAPPKQRSEASIPPEQRIAEASPNTVATHAQPHMAWRAAPSPQSDVPSEAMPSPLDREEAMPQFSNACLVLQLDKKRTHSCWLFSAGTGVQCHGRVVLELHNRLLRTHWRTSLFPLPVREVLCKRKIPLRSELHQKSEALDPWLRIQMLSLKRHSKEIQLPTLTMAR